MADRMAMKRWVRRLGMRPTVGVDAAQPVAVGFAEHRHSAGGKQDFHRVVSDQHPGRMRLGEAAVKDQFRTAGLLLGPHLLDFLGYLSFPRAGLLLAYFTSSLTSLFPPPLHSPNLPTPP